MTTFDRPAAEAALVLHCIDLAANLDFFVDELGFKVEEIFPADQPREATIRGFGLRLQLRQGQGDDHVLLRLQMPGSVPSGVRTAPNGSRIEVVSIPENDTLPKLNAALEIARQGDWHPGRAGMGYRDLIPSRWGGRFIASHIRIDAAGPVPDYVHHHDVHFQLIYCVAGWVRVAYQDQGEPIVMQPGDCVLQPPGIRHRVLECSAGLEVVEVSCPAEHRTYGDLHMNLPTEDVRPEATYGGQRFVFHQSTAGTITAVGDLEVRDLGLEHASNGRVSGKVVRANGEYMETVIVDDQFYFMFVLTGSLSLQYEEHQATLQRADSVAIPQQTSVRFHCVGPAVWLLIQVPVER